MVSLFIAISPLDMKTLESSQANIFRFCSAFNLDFIVNTHVTGKVFMNILMHIVSYISRVFSSLFTRSKHPKALLIFNLSSLQILHIHKLYYFLFVKLQWESQILIFNPSP